MHITEVIRIFAQSEEEQAVYFPKFEKSVIVSVGSFEMITNSSRLVALCALAYASKKGEIYQGDRYQVCHEIAALSNLIIQDSVIYDWLLLHPKDAQEQLYDGNIDPTIFGVWDIMRRLCLIAISLLPVSYELKSFSELFSSIIVDFDPDFRGHS